MLMRSRVHRWLPSRVATRVVSFTGASRRVTELWMPFESHIKPLCHVFGPASWLLSVLTSSVPNRHLASAPPPMNASSSSHLIPLQSAPANGLLAPSFPCSTSSSTALPIHHAKNAKHLLGSLNCTQIFFFFPPLLAERSSTLSCLH